MMEPMYSVEAIDATEYYHKKHDDVLKQEETDFYINELDKANKKIDQLLHFIEMTEALTYDQATAKRIHSFLTQQGIWTK